MNSQQVAFEPFGTLDGVLRGEPIKIMPIGTFFRGKRQIDISAADLQKIAFNLKSGLPRFRIPINENHAGTGKIGTVYDVAFDPAGADGPGLYATKYDLTDAGKKLVAERRFDAVSPEMVWSKNGAKYQDPQTGAEHDNVLVGLALTERPFFGHDNVALYSERQEDEMAEDKKPNIMQKFKDMMSQMMKLLEQEEQDEGETTPAQSMNIADLIKIDGFKDYDTETRKDFAKKGWALPDGSYPIADGGDLTDAIHRVGSGNAPTATVKAHIVKRAKALGLTDKLPPEWAGSTKETANTQQEAEHMSNQTQAPPEAFTVKAEEFKALQDKAALVDGLKAQIDQFSTKLTETEAQLNKTRRDRALDQMVQHAENFVAIPGKPAEIGEKLLVLQEKDPELFKYFDGLLSTLDKQLTQSELFSQKVSGREEEGVDSFDALVEQVLVEKFAGDRAKYGDAMKVAEKQRPDLAKAYANMGRGG